MEDLINEQILESLYEEEYEAIYLEIVENSDVTESTRLDNTYGRNKEIMHKLATERAKKRFEEQAQ